MPASKKTGPKTGVAKIESIVLRKAKSVADSKGVDLSDYLTGILRSPVERDWAKVIKAIAESEVAE
jgi:hypothetical protein